MNKKELEIVCPCCGSQLTVDLRTEKVVRQRASGSRSAEDRPPTGGPVEAGDWEAMVERVRDRAGESADKLESALDRERKRETDLDDLFRRVRERVDDEGE